jgi:DNA invertase Pin-like site-specific DNA recombinase
MENDAVLCMCVRKAVKLYVALNQPLTDKGVTVEFVKENLTFTGDDSPLSDLLLGILGSIAQFERAIIRERQREGIALAKKAGVYKGRKPTMTPDKVRTSARAEAGERIAALAREYGVSRETLYAHGLRSGGGAE